MYILAKHKTMIKYYTSIRMATIKYKISIPSFEQEYRITGTLHTCQSVNCYKLFETVKQYLSKLNICIL